jgi:hypothetical protein
MLLFESDSSNFGVGSFLIIALAVGVVAFIALKMRRYFDRLGKEFGQLIAVVVGIGVVSEVVRAGFSFLKGVDWASVGEDLKKAIEEAAREVETQPSGLARLERAQTLLDSGGEIEREAAAMLASATLEHGLRVLAKRAGVDVAAEDNSLAGLAILLATGGHITWDEKKEIAYYATAIRNRVMHGDLGAIASQDVANLIKSTRSFFAAHRIQ